MTKYIFLYTTEVHCNSYPCSSLGKVYFFFGFFQEFLFLQFSVVWICYAYIWGFWSLYCLLFSELSTSMVCCLSLILKCPWSNYSKHFSFSVIFCFPFWYYIYTYITPSEVVSQFLDILFFLNYFSLCISIWGPSYFPAYVNELIPQRKMLDHCIMVLFISILLSMKKKPKTLLIYSVYLWVQRIKGIQILHMLSVSNVSFISVEQKNYSMEIQYLSDIFVSIN